MVFVGSAAHGRVRVELTEADGTPTVQLLPGWRTATAERLGPAVLQAFAAATAARLQALAAAPPEFDFTAAAAVRALGSGHHTAVLLADAARELPAFLGQLAALHAAPRTAASAGGQVAATVRGGQVVALTVAPAWQARADDATLAHGLGEALRAGLGLLADTRDQALAGCPALVAALRLTASGVCPPQHSGRDVEPVVPGRPGAAVAARRPTTHRGREGAEGYPAAVGAAR